MINATDSDRHTLPLATIMPAVQRTYGSRNRHAIAPPSSPASGLSSSPPPSSVQRPSKRPFVEIETSKSKENVPPAKRLKSCTNSTEMPTKGSSKSKGKAKGGQSKLTQLHFSIDRSILRTCPKCDLTYTTGALDDETLHKSHCTRVQQGMDWGREEEKDRLRTGGDIVTEIKSDIRLKARKKHGRIICFPADVAGKIGTKVSWSLSSCHGQSDDPPPAAQHPASNSQSSPLRS